MKLIIDIPELDYECAKQRWIHGDDTHQMDYYISKGIPLDDVKAKIANIDSYKRDGCCVLADALRVLNNIGKAESKDKK